jgi:glycosyltransferase involved in cell wall biosynthesis
VRLAYICADPGVPVFGSKGASVHVQEVVRALQRRGVSVELFAACPDCHSSRQLEEVRCHALPLPSENSPAARERAAVAANYRLNEMLHDTAPFDVVYERYSLWSFAGMEYARGESIPGLLEVNAPLIEEQAAHRILVDRPMAENVAARAFGAATAALAVSREVAEYVTRFTDDSRVHVLPNGVDPGRCAPHIPPRLPASPGVCTLGFAGSLKPWHGIDVLLDAFGQIHRVVPQSRLLLVGDGPARSIAETSARRFGLSDSVILTGAVSPEEVPGLLTSMDVAAAPYPDNPDFYFSPLKIFEYMAAGIPTVASRIGQVTEIIEHEVTGILCPPGNPDALARSVIDLFINGAKRRRLGRSARRYVCAVHTWDSVVARILEIASSARDQSNHRAHREHRVKNPSLSELSVLRGRTRP